MPGEPSSVTEDAKEESGRHQDFVFHKTVEATPQRQDLRSTKSEKILPSPQRRMFLEQCSAMW